MKNGEVGRWRELGLKTKLLIINIVVIILPVVLLDTYFFAVTIKSSRENALAILRSSQESIALSIEGRAANVERMAEILALDSDIRAAFGSTYTDESKRVVDYQLLTGGSVGHMLKFNQDVNAIYLYNDQIVICEMADSFVSVQKEKAPEVFDSMQLDRPNTAQKWIFAREGLQNVVRPETTPSKAFSFQRMVMSPGGRQCAVIEIVTDQKDMLRAMYEQNLLKGGYSCIVNRDGQILYSTVGGGADDIQMEDYHPGQQDEQIQNGALQIALPLPALDVSLVTRVPLRSLYSTLYSSALMVVGLSALLLVLCCWLFSVFAQRQLRPIAPMMQAMTQIRGGNFSARVPSQSMDELGALARDFNFMSEKLQDLVDQVYFAGQMEREAELRALATNINPHFLYNSLATITWMARAKQSPEIVELTEALAHLYRAVLSDGRSILPFRDEMEIVNAYLKVQKFRFENKCRVEIDVTEEAMDFPIIKNILQPLVENALEHGIGPKLDDGTIWLQARVVDDELEVCIRDDGVGMSEEHRQEVVCGRLKERRRGYAIRNIRERLNMYCEGHYVFSLHSEQNRGTEVHLVLPRPKTIWKDDVHDPAGDRRG